MNAGIFYFYLLYYIYMPTLNTTSSLGYGLNNYHDRMLQERALPLIVHDKFGQQRPLPANNTKTINFRRYGALQPNTTPLQEGVTPDGKSLAVTDIPATVEQYGDYVTVTDFLLGTQLDPVLMEAAEVLGEQAAQSIDIIIRDKIVVGTSVQYSDATAPATNDERTDIVAADVIDTDDVKLAALVLKQNNAMKITTMVSPDPGYDTRPIAACFVGIIHPNIAYTLEGLTGFVPVEKYANKAMDLMPGEIGKLGDVRFIETTQAKVWEDGGAGGAVDVYGTLILGKNAYGVTKLAGKGLQNIVKAVGSSGAADPLNQRGTSGWKAELTAVILNDDFMVRIESASVV